jgi:hypothetical protein
LLRAPRGWERPPTLAAEAYCAVVGCLAGAATEVLYQEESRPDRAGSLVWVPLCTGHRQVAGYRALTWTVQVSGVFPPLAPPPN